MSSDALDALPPDATAERVNQWNKNTLVWLRAPRTLVLDELLPAALSAPPAATELLSQSAATAGILPRFQPLQPRPCVCRSLLRLLWTASGPDPARLPFVLEPVSGAHPAWLERWFLAKEAQEWEWVKIEKEEKEKLVNSKPKTEHVANLATLARLHGRGE